jgi:hypothetical protein
MILRELFFADKDAISVANDHRYEGGRDSTTITRKDTRKTRLTLGQINELRKASEQHILEQEKELEFVEQMYKAPVAPPA